MDPDLTPAARAARAAIVAARLAWSATADLEAAGHDATTLGGLGAAGLVAGWDRAPGGPAVTLTPYAAAALGVEVQERTRVERIAHRERVTCDDEIERTIAWTEVVLVEEPRWVRAGTVPPPLIVPRQSRQGGLALPELVVDPTSGEDLPDPDDDQPAYRVDEAGAAFRRDEATGREYLIDPAHGALITLFGHPIERARTRPPSGVGPAPRRTTA